MTTIIANYNPGVSEAVAFEYVSVPLIKALVSGGAHFDFRNQLGFSPLHVAVRNGNAQAVKVSSIISTVVIAFVFYFILDYGFVWE